MLSLSSTFSFTYSVFTLSRVLHHHSSSQTQPQTTTRWRAKQAAARVIHSILLYASYQSSTGNTFKFTEVPLSTAVPGHFLGFWPLPSQSQVRHLGTTGKRLAKVSICVAPCETWELNKSRRSLNKQLTAHISALYSVFCSPKHRCTGSPRSADQHSNTLSAINVFKTQAPQVVEI